jgi:hypothetical protein
MVMDYRGGIQLVKEELHQVNEVSLCSPKDNTSTSLPIMEASLSYVAA